MKHIKLFEQFEDDPFGEEIIRDRNITTVGDTVILINRDGARYVEIVDRRKHGSFVETGFDIGDRLRIDQIRKLETGQTIFRFNNMWYNIKNFIKE